MTPEERPLYEIVEKLEAAWNRGDSVAWTELFADDADFIHVLGGHFHGKTDIEHGHRTIFDTIYKGSRNSFEVEGVRFVRPDVAVVFIFANLTWYLNGAEQHIQARPTLVAERDPDGSWKIVVFQNTLVTTDAVPTLADTLAQAHPIKGNPPVK
ncbi:MAG TPA: SgcJ/EcaC family oxidoreductase [Terriglobales bacterium]